MPVVYSYSVLIEYLLCVSATILLIGAWNRSEQNRKENLLPGRLHLLMGEAGNFTKYMFQNVLEGIKNV